MPLIVHRLLVDDLELKFDVLTHYPLTIGQGGDIHSV